MTATDAPSAPPRPITPPCTCEARRSSPVPREQWRYVGRETHWGYDYLIWELTANPRGHAKIGSRWAQVVL